MSAVPRLPELLPAENAEAFSRAIAGLDAPALWWLSGYTAGLAQAQYRGGVTIPIAAPATTVERSPGQRVTVLYGSQTGNARRVAEGLAGELEAAGLAVRLIRADAYPLRELKDERLLYLVISTQGEGDPPEDSQALVEFLSGRRAPELKQLKFAVLGLGDSSYPQFCAVGKRLDARLAELGAQRLFERADADVEVEAIAAPWRARALQEARQAQPSVDTPLATVTPLRRPLTPSVSRDKPAPLELIANQRISGRGSAKDVRHIELDLSGSGLSYEPGDALGVWTENPPALVDAILAATQLDGEQILALNNDSRPLRDWLSSQREITRAARGVLQALAEHHDDDTLQQALRQPEAAAAWLARYPLLDALQRWPVAWDGEALLRALRPLSPRLYSIASSRAVVGDEAHLTVDVLRYAVDERIHVGAASSFLARQGEGGRVRAYIEPNERFRLPTDPSRDLIMIGAGTGIAPYRGFVQQRSASGASGKHWLLFGAQHFRSDFLYQAEWLQARQRGQLQRIDLAFSRDAADKIYVQDRLRQHGRAVYDGLQNGAHLYVCGAIAMGRDVHTALIDVVVQQSGKDREAAEGFLRELAQSGRYRKDVY